MEGCFLERQRHPILVGPVVVLEVASSVGELAADDLGALVAVGSEDEPVVAVAGQLVEALAS